MVHARTTRFAMVASVLTLALALLLAATGCGKKTADTSDTAPTAKGALTVARSALSTMAPDAKLLLVQTATSVTPTSVPVWAYLFGSPKDGKTYAVYVEKGRAISASEYGTAGLSDSEWSSVPGVDSWKIDSDAALEKALTASGADGDPAAYNMGLLTYVPASSTSSSTTQAFVWYVAFDPGTSGATTGTIEVDAKTGAAATK